MQPISFISPISANSEIKFSKTAFFDDYFCYSGHKYRVVKPNDERFIVQAYQEKSSLLLNVLKIISLATIIIPLGMLIGKLIARSQNSFITVSNSARLQPPDPLKTKKEKEAIQSFQSNALSVMERAEVAPVSDPVELDLTEEQKQILNEAMQYGHPKGATVIRGGINRVIILDTLPQYVFKPMEEEAAKEYLEKVVSGQKLIQDKNLYILHVPASQIVKIGHMCFVMQERLPIIRGEKGAYTHCCEEGTLKDYVRKLFLQLTVFITETGFSDVKYDNIPLTTEGKVALIDLDQLSAVCGLTSGGAAKPAGLFRYIPLSILDELHELAKGKLKEDEKKTLSELVVKMKEKAPLKAERRSKYHTFLTKNQIQSSTQLVSADFGNLFSDPRKNEVTRIIVDEINKKLEKSVNLSVKHGRKIFLEININQFLYKEVEKIYQNKISYAQYPWNPRNEITFLGVIEEVLELLTIANYIYKFKINRNYSIVKVSC